MTVYHVEPGRTTADRPEAERYRAHGWWREGTALDDLRAATAARPSKPAIVAYRAGGVETITYADLSERVDCFARALLALGVRPGEIVSLQLPNWWELAALCLACTRIGAVVNPLMPILRRRELSLILARTESRVCVVPDTWRRFSHRRLIEELSESIPTLEHPLVVGSSFDDHFLDERWRDGDPAELDALAPSSDALAQVLFTSGTTGEPKGVMHTHATLYAATRGQPLALGLTGDDVVTMGSPMTHQAGYLYCLLMPLLLGATAVYQEAWDPHLMLRIVEQHGVTFTMGAPPFVLDALAAQRAVPRDVFTLRAFACGSAPVPPHVVEEVAEVLGCRLYALWGMTENGTVTITRPEDPPLRAAESDGTPIPWMEVGIAAPEGQVGPLLVRGASQCVGYFKRPDLYAECLDADGWFDTGDLARSDGHGGIRIAGRTKDMIMRGGENIPVVEVEGALYRHARVREVTVVGYPDERLGERACAVVAAEGEPPTLEELCSHLDELGMARQYWPERLVIVDELPKTPSGKVQKFLLRERLV